MLSLRKVAVTGGPASGKTTVCSFLREFGGFVVDADTIVHHLLSPNTVIGRQVVNLLGSAVVTENQIDRKKVAKLVFSDPEKLHSLESILHPAVKEEIKTLYNQAKNDPNYTFFVAEIPLLYEAKMESFFDTIIAVSSDRRVAKQRFQASHFEERMARQESSQKKATKAHFTLINNGDLAALKEAVFKLASQL